MGGGKRQRIGGDQLISETSVEGISEDPVDFELWFVTDESGLFQEYQVRFDLPVMAGDQEIRVWFTRVPNERRLTAGQELIFPPLNKLMNTVVPPGETNGGTMVSVTVALPLSALEDDTADPKGTPEAFGLVGVPAFLTDFEYSKDQCNANLLGIELGVGRDGLVSDCSDEKCAAIARDTVVEAMAAALPRLGLTDVQRVLSAFLGVGTSGVELASRGGLVGFGSFSISDRAARTGRNPQTGKEIQIAAKNVVRFKVMSELSGVVN
jgi:DNA-binding protein HU-beta